jgi:hypothetical protein
MVRFDIEYSKRLSLWLDLKIILKTLPALGRQYADLQAAKPREVLPRVSNALESFSG